MKILKFTISLFLCFSSLILFAQVDDLVYHYKFDGNLEEEVADSHAVFVAGAAAITEPSYMEGFDETADGAILFGGTLDTYYMIKLGRFCASCEGAQDEITIAFWAYWNGPTGSYQDIINKRDNWDPADMMWGINQHANTGHIISVKRKGTELNSAESIDSIPTGEWTHVAIALDNENAYFYKNGVQYDEKPYTFGTGYNARIHAGSSGNSDGTTRDNDIYNGALDDVRFYSRVLDDDEVLAIYEGEADISGIENKVAAQFQLAQNYPNPFNLTTQISYSLEKGTRVELDVYNIHGQKVAALVNQHQWAGTHKVVWDATNASAGVYFYKMKVDNHVVSKRMLLVK
jgi:hypothetical protein